MKVNNISFGKKIPVMTFQVQDMKRKTFVPVVMSEYDCRDTSDIDIVNSLRNKWIFAQSIADGMHIKNSGLDKNLESPFNFYVVNNPKGEIIGLCQTVQTGKDIDIFYIETKKKAYKYVGQSIIAALGKKLLDNNGGNIEISAAASSAKPFYIEKCGFKQVYRDKNMYNLEMNKEQIKGFISRVEEKTGAPILDVEG